MLRLKRSSRVWEILALLLVIIALGAFALPSQDDLFMPKEPDEILIRMSIQETGGFDPSEIRLQKGETVKLIFLGMDVAHGFAAEGLGINTGLIMPAQGKVAIELTPKEAGVFPFECTAFCSPDHFSMRGTIFVDDETTLTPTPTPTPAVKEFYLIADQWAFNETNPTITVNKGDTVKLVILSLLSQENGDVYPGHGIFITGYNIEEDLPVGTTTTLEFVADIPGEFNYLCSIYCGPDHGIMAGTFVVLG